MLLLLILQGGIYFQLWNKQRLPIIMAYGGKKNLTKGQALLIHLSKSKKWINKADAIQTVYEHFQERVEGYQELFVSLHKGSVKYFITKQRANIYKWFKTKIKAQMLIHCYLPI